MARYRRRSTALSIFVVITSLVYLLAAQQGWLDSTPQKIEQSQPGLYSVSHFVDGDTIAVDMNGSIETIRMIGVDTPETHKPNTPVQCYGPQAADFTKNMIGQNKVRLQADPLDTNRDRYGRLLRYVYLPDGRMVETQLISNGYGFAYTLFPFQKKDEFVSDMQSAENTKKGLWAACQVHQETSGAYQTNPA
jgi:micrococcal nuclease